MPIGEMWARVNAWLQEPFRQPVSAWEIILGVGLVLFALAGWHRVVKVIGREV